MLKEQLIKLKVSMKNIKSLNEHGIITNIGDIIEVCPTALPKGSHIIVSVVCDVCGKEKELSYQKYLKNINNGGFYVCSSKCAQDKVKKTSLEKFGSEYYTQTEEYNKRVNRTSLEKFGVEHFTQNEKVKQKQKETTMKNYGVDNYSQTDEFKENFKKYSLGKYGVENP